MQPLFLDGDDLAFAVPLAPVLDMAAAAPLHASLLSLRGSDVTLDGSQVQRIGGQCLQVLLAARRAWRDDGNALEIVHLQSDVVQTLKLMGADELVLDGNTV